MAGAGGLRRTACCLPRLREFHHVVASYDTASGERSIWIDGVKAWSVMLEAGTVPVTGGGAAAFIGNTLGRSDSFTGIIDDFAFWERALTAEEIAVHGERAHRQEHSGFRRSHRWLHC